ncbi:MAG: tRNA (adenosine(37)-N6)-dimethylallyltransferase MiaA [Pseudomonadota bacterium]
MKISTPNKLLVVAGPTASGKTTISMKIAEKMGAEITSADSLLVYKRMDIGTAKPSKKEREQVPHHLIDVVEPSEEYTVSDYREDAVSKMEEIKSRGKDFIVAGGTGFYINALINETFKTPKADPELRKELEEKKDLYEELKKIDPQSAERIHPNDKYRTVRAMEVYYTSKKTMTQFREEHKKISKRMEPLIIVLNPSKEELLKNIDIRTNKMLRMGLVEEVNDLIKSGISTNLKPMKSIGYKQAVDFIQGRITEDEMTKNIRAETAALAKRQVTWFKKQEHTRWYHPVKDMDRIRNDIVSFIG